MAKAKTEADELRAAENAAFKKNSAEMKMGIDGVGKALQVLKEYYAKGDKSHSAADGAGSSIIGLLEVCESDFTKGLTEMTAEEETAAADHESYSKQYEVETTSKSQDVKYKGQESAGLDKAVAETTTDLSAVTEELTAVISSLDKLHKMCDEKVVPYAERKARRESEIAGLKEALTILESETMLIQKSAKHTLRGARLHKHSA